MPFDFERLSIPDLILIKPEIFPDNRGYFMETYKRSDFRKAGINDLFVQDYHSYSIKGVIRGLHYQLNPMAQGKLVRCIKGQIFDVAVDIRQGSPTYGQWVSIYLSEETGSFLYIPEGFAHGLCSLSEDVHIFSKVTKEYAPEYDFGIIWNDPEINITWPIDNPIISSKDADLPHFSDAPNNFEYQVSGAVF